MIESKRYTTALPEVLYKGGSAARLGMSPLSWNTGWEDHINSSLEGEQVIEKQKKKYLV